METFEAIQTVLAVRDYSDRAVPEDAIRRILEAGRLTGSSMNGQPWQFVLVQNRETLGKLADLLQSGRYTADAPFAVVIAVERSSQFGLSDASRAIQSMALAAWSEGIGSNWAGWVGMTEVAALLGMPDSLDAIAVMPFGYPAKPATGVKKNRRPFSEVVHAERFGQPFAG